MNKKIIRTIIALCLMLIMTSTTAFAAVTDISTDAVTDHSTTKYFKYNVEKGVYVKLAVTGVYSSVDHSSEITYIDATFTGPNSDEYSCLVQDNYARIFSATDNPLCVTFYINYNGRIRAKALRY